MVLVRVSASCWRLFPWLLFPWLLLPQLLFSMAENDASRVSTITIIYPPDHAHQHLKNDHGIHAHEYIIDEYHTLAQSNIGIRNRF